MSSGNLLRRLRPVVGKPVATVVAEPGADRHFILELTFSAVVGYLAGKFLDGFVEGLGVNDLGKSVGRKVREAVTGLGKLVLEAEASPEQELRLQTYVEVIEIAVDQLASEATDPTALSFGEKAVSETLLEKGLPPIESRRLAARIREHIFLIDAPPNHDG